MSKLPERIPPCAVKMLARPEWFADPGVVSRARLSGATGLAQLFSSRFFARTEIGAITLGRVIHFRMSEQYDPHSAWGLALLAHELKHVEQYEKDGWCKFYAKYLWAYVFHGYGESVPFEAAAYEFQRQVQAHLTAEFENNLGCSPCCEIGDPHTPNETFVKIAL